MEVQDERVLEGFESKAKETIENIEYLNIASITPDGLPWNSPVYTVYDDNLNFYWASWQQNQHSTNIRMHPNVFVTIYDSTVKCGEGFGVYMSGTAKIVNNPILIGQCLIKFLQRGKLSYGKVEEFLKSYPRRIYQFTPDKIWVNGDSEIEGNFIDVRTEIRLANLRGLFKA